MLSPHTLLALLILMCMGLAPLTATAAQAPFVGDEGLEPRERRLEMALGTDSLGVAYRVGYPRRTGVSGIASVRTQWRGGWTALGAGAAYRVFGGYPLRLVFRLDFEVGFGPIHGPSLGGRFTPGVAAELGREGRLTATVGASLPLSYYVLPERVVKREVAYDGVISVPIRERWRGGAGVQVSQVSQGVDEVYSTTRLNVFVGVARWF